MTTEDFQLPFAPDTYIGFVSGLVLEAGRIRSKIEIDCGGKSHDVKSFLGVLNTGISPGAVFTLRAEGDDEQQALAQLSAYINRFR